MVTSPSSYSVPKFGSFSFSNTSHTKSVNPIGSMKYIPNLTTSHQFHSTILVQAATIFLDCCICHLSHLPVPTLLPLSTFHTIAFKHPSHVIPLLKIFQWPLIVVTVKAQVLIVVSETLSDLALRYLSDLMTSSPTSYH